MPLGRSLNPFSAVGDLRRAKYILSILLRYGFEEAVERLNLPFQPLAEKLTRVPAHIGPAPRLRMMLEELGPTFIKVGQFFSMRPDLLPAFIVLELKKLQDDVPPVDFARVCRAMEESLGGKIEVYFSSLEEKPLASASLAQVHRGRLRAGSRPVICKVRRPGLVEMVKADFNLIAFFARQAHERLEELQHYNLPAAVEEARRSLLEELDFNIERSHMIHSRRLAETEPVVMIPAVVEEVSSRDLLVMEELDGLKVERLAGEEIRKKAAENLARVVFRQVMVDGFFHADPHAGNVRFTPDGGVILLDWGLVGRLSWTMRFKLGEFVEAVAEGDPAWVVDCALALSGRTDLEDREGLERDMLALLDQFRLPALAQVDLGQVLIRIFEVLGRYRLTVNTHYLLVARALMNVESLVRELDPGFDIMERVREYLKQVNLERMRPSRFWGIFRRNLYQSAALLEGFPGRVNNILTKLEKGKLTIVYQHTGLEKMISSLRTAGNLLVIGLIISSLIVGSSLIIFSGAPPRLLGFPVLGLIGYLISAVLGLLVIYRIIRNR